MDETQRQKMITLPRRNVSLDSLKIPPDLSFSTYTEVGKFIYPRSLGS